MGTTTMTTRTIEPLENHQGASLRGLLNVIFKRKWLVLIFFASSVATVTIFTVFFTKPVYQATSQILVSPGREHISDVTLPTGGAVPPRLSFNAEEQTARTIEMLTGRFLAERVVRAIGPTVLYGNLTGGLLGKVSSIWRGPLDEETLLERAIGKVLENVTAEPAGKSSIIHLSFNHEDPEMAAKVVNLLGELYLERHLGIQKNPRTDAFFQEQFEVLKQKLKESEEKLETFKQRNSVTSSVKDEQELATRELVTLRSALTDTRSKQAEVQSRMGELRRQLANTSQTPGANEKVRDRLTSLELQENELALRFTPENPTLRNIREEIRQLREKLATLENVKAYGNSASREGNLYASLQEELLRNEAEVKALRAREEGQNAKVAEFQRRLNTLERIDTDFSHLQKQLQLDDQNYRLYRTKFEESRISSAMDAEKIASVRVIEDAQPPASPLNSKANLKILLGILFGAVGGVFLAFVLHFVSGRLDTVEDIERTLDLPVLAAIPELELK